MWLGPKAEGDARASGGWNHVPGDKYMQFGVWGHCREGRGTETAAIVIPALRRGQLCTALRSPVWKKGHSEAPSFGTAKFCNTLLCISMHNTGNEKGTKQ